MLHISHCLLYTSYCQVNMPNNFLDSAFALTGEYAICTLASHSVGVVYNNGVCFTCIAYTLTYCSAVYQPALPDNASALINVKWPFPLVECKRCRSQSTGYVAALCMSITPLLGGLNCERLALAGTPEHLALTADRPTHHVGAQGYRYAYSD